MRGWSGSLAGPAVSLKSSGIPPQHLACVRGCRRRQVQAQRALERLASTGGVAGFRQRDAEVVLDHRVAGRGVCGLLQLLNSHNTRVSEQQYLEVIRRKTAKLFEAAAQLGGVLGGAVPAAESGLARYGMHLGTAFQLIDDVLDYSGDAAHTGKNLGDDLNEGKPTLPLIYVMERGSEAQALTVPVIAGREPLVNWTMPVTVN